MWAPSSATDRFPSTLSGSSTGRLCGSASRDPIDRLFAARALLLAARYLSSLLVQAGQNGACNRIHDMQQRSAKWLLLSHDRREDELLDLTQEFFATMLGSRVPSSAGWSARCAITGSSAIVVGARS